MKRLLLLVGVVVLLFSCRKSSETFIPNNQAPYYGGIPTVLVENYVNRLFIDLVGREPIDSEMVAEVAFLRSHQLSMDARDSLVRKLMYNDDPVAGDSSYAFFYWQRLYDLLKIRLIEGASDAQIGQEIGILQAGYVVDSLNGDTAAMAMKRFQMAKYENILACQHQLRYGEISIDTVCARLVDNPIYDFINMNSFNFINATFDNLFYRYPTQSEFARAYTMVDASQPASLFGLTGSNKAEYIQIIVAQRELFEGWISWCYQTLLARFPNSSERYALLPYFIQSKDLQFVQRKILITDEYANFR